MTNEELKEEYYRKGIEKLDQEKESQKFTQQVFCGCLALAFVGIIIVPIIVALFFSL